MSTNYSRLDGKICLITGATDGIGKAAAIEIAKLGATMILTTRNLEKGKLVQKEIQAKSNNPQISLLNVDLALLCEVHKAAEIFQSQYDHLDIMINNAGIFNPAKCLSVDGYEATFAVDYLAHFLLTKDLQSLIEKSKSARIVNVASDIHYYMPFDITDSQFSRRKYKSQLAYASAKTAMILFTYALAQKLESKHILVNSLHPGHVRTQMYTGNPSKVFRWIVGHMPVFKTPENAAKTIVYCVASPEVEGITGKYFKNCRPVLSKKLTYDSQLQQQMWAISEELIKIKGN